MRRVVTPSALAAAAAVVAAVSLAPALVRAQQLAAAGPGGIPLMPPNAKAGECYTRVYVPAVYDTTSEQVLRKEAAEKIEVVPARFETVKEEVLIKEEVEKIEVVPATFKEVEEQVLLKPEVEELVVIPAEYQDVEEQIEVRAAYTTWQTNCGPIERISTTTGETLCLVEVPAEFQKVRKRVLKSPARTEVVKVPAEYTTVRKQVVDTPATTRTIKVPAEYTTVSVQKLVEPAREIRTPIPEEYETVSKTIKTEDARVEWRQILCERNVTPEMVRRIQTTLQEKGLYRGGIDGAIGPGTLAGIIAFQKANNLPTGQLTTETIQALGLAD